jgi:hypothetical protein
MAVKRYQCPICGRQVEYTAAFPEPYPFCSPRCRRVDLGRWFGGSYVIEREMTPEELADARPDSPAEE